jgi:hypothetical protein
MFEHGDVRHLLPQPLIDYADGVVMKRPKGYFEPEDLWRARRLRMTFWRRLHENGREWVGNGQTTGH